MKNSLKRFNFKNISKLNEFNKNLNFNNRFENCFLSKFQLSKFNKNHFSAEIKIKADSNKIFYPSRGPIDFKDNKFTIFQYEPEPIRKDEIGTYQRLPQVPYEIKENALKGFLYTFFLAWGGRFLSSLSDSFLLSLGTTFHFIPAAVFVFFYSRTLNLMYNAVTAIKLKEDGKTVILEFKLRKSIEVEIKRILKNKEENFLMECYSEPFLFPLILDYTDVYSAYSLKSKRTVYLYGDSKDCIKNGELLRAVINGQTIKTS